MVAADRDRIVIADLVSRDVFLYITHHAQGKLDREQAFILCLFFLQDIRLQGAPQLRQGVTANA